MAGLVSEMNEFGCQLYVSGWLVLYVDKCFCSGLQEGISVSYLNVRVSGNDEPFIYFLLSLHVLEGMAQRLRGMTIFPEIRVRIPVPPIIYFLLSGECEIVRR